MSNDFLVVVEICRDIDFGLSDCRLYFVCTSIIFSSTVGSKADPRRTVVVVLLFDFQKSDKLVSKFEKSKLEMHLTFCLQLTDVPI